MKGISQRPTKSLGFSLSTSDFPTGNVDKVGWERIQTNRKNFITVMQNEINKTAKVVVEYFILSILTDLCSILSKRNIICQYRVNS
jgi:hypothetical protein